MALGTTGGAPETGSTRATSPHHAPFSPSFRLQSWRTLLVAASPAALVDVEASVDAVAAMATVAGAGERAPLSP